MTGIAELNHFLTMPANFKGKVDKLLNHSSNFLKYFLHSIAFLISFILVGCVSTPTPPPVPEMTQLQIRQLQTREYSSTEYITVMKAVISAFQDEGFIITNANSELGLITSGMEIFEEDKATKQWIEFWYGSGMGTYQTTKRFEASATVRQHGDVIRVRINVVAKAISNTGGIIWSQPVYDSKVYQGLFSKIDKAVYLEKEKI